MPPTDTKTPSSENSQFIEPDEHVLVVVKKHWIGLVGIIATSFSALVSLLILAVVLGSDSSNYDGSTYGLVMVVGLLVIGISICMMFIIAYIYTRSRLTITDESLVQVNQTSLFNKKTARLSMSNVEDVSVEQRGMISSIFGYGTLTVQTAGEEDNFIFSSCPEPNRYAEIILDARQNYAQRHPAA